MTKKIFYTIGLFIAFAIIYFAYYIISPQFRELKLNEEVPVKTGDSSGVTELSEQKLASVIGTIGHPATGTARIIESSGKNYIRYENYKTINGPDLFVYLAKDLDAKDFVSLGALRATEGNVNYEVPDNVSISDYRYVLTWCKQFGVLFNYADIRASETK